MRRRRSRGEKRNRKGDVAGSLREKFENANSMMVVVLRFRRVFCPLKGRAINYFLLMHNLQCTPMLILIVHMYIHGSAYIQHPPILHPTFHSFPRSCIFFPFSTTTSLRPPARGRQMLANRESPALSLARDFYTRQHPVCTVEGVPSSFLLILLRLFPFCLLFPRVPRRPAGDTPYPRCTTPTMDTMRIRTISTTTRTPRISSP